MRKKFVQFAAFILALILVPVLPAAALPGEEEEMLIRVGLYYGSSALPGANLQNDVGSGYRFGYVDRDTFYEVGFTEETKISMVKAQNVWYSSSLPGGGYGYSDQITSNIVVGCYHLSLPGMYDTFEEAQEVADAVGGFPAWIQGEYQVRIGAYTSKGEAEEAALDWDDVTVVGTSSYGITVVTTGSDQPVFQFDGGTEIPIFVVKPGLDDEEKTITHFKGNRYYGSFCYERISGGNLTVVNLVSMEDYVNCVISREMSDSWPIEALKAQAVCARSYAVSCMGKHTSYHFDLCSTTDCQAYYGVNSTGANTARATEETAGQYAWYDGEIIQAFYHSSDGGATENVENVWTSQLPYLQGVEDPYEALVADKIPNYYWTVTYTGKELQEKFNANGYPCGEIVDLRVAKTTETGNVYSVSFTDVNGKTWTVSKYKFVHSILGAKSMRYTISGGGTGESYSLTNEDTLNSLNGAWVLDGKGKVVQINSGTVCAITGSGVETVSAPISSDGTFVLSGSGNGHNLGMSQWGAYAMAMEGYTYEEILHFYFTGIEIR